MALSVEDTIDIIDYTPEVNGTVLLSPKLEDIESPLEAEVLHIKESQIHPQRYYKESIKIVFYQVL